MGRTLLGSDEVLNITFGHDRGFAGACPRIQSDVAVEVQTQALAVVEFNHQKSPPE